MVFPKYFIWGAASSAYQTEGHPTAPSIWDTFCQKEGAIADGSDGSVATDGYHRYQEDIALLAQMGLGAYRFSVSWARLDPQGTGMWDEAGFSYYQRVIACCLEHNVIPFVTLYHWELPQALEDKGGWRSRDTAHAFARYAQEVARRFVGEVTHFITLNEPQCTVFLGHGNGVHAPGLQLDLPGQFATLHHQLLAHGLAVRAIRNVAPQAQIGIASTGRLCYPKTEADVAAAACATFETSDDNWGFTHQMVLDPICFGHYPDNPGAQLRDCFAKVDPEDLAVIAQPMDFMGLNIYNGNEIVEDPNGAPCYVPKPQGYPITALGWPVTPQVMDWGVRTIYKRYGLPIYITENGMSCHDCISVDGAVHDPNRIDFLHRYLQALSQGMAQGADVQGYFHWSLTDNFEWNAGYSQRFGLVYIDYATGQRIPKDSAHWLANLVRS